MEEFEYVIKAAQEYLSDLNTAAISLESYTNKAAPDVFIGFFDEFTNIIEEFNHIGDSSELSKKDLLFINRQKDIFDRFIIELKDKSESDDTIIDEIAEKYKKRNDISLASVWEKRILVYPFIIEEVRKVERANA